MIFRCISVIVHHKVDNLLNIPIEKKKKYKKGGAKITLHSSCHDKQLKLFTI